MWGLWTELTYTICPLLLFCYSRGGSLLFLVKKKKLQQNLLLATKQHIQEIIVSTLSSLL